MSDTTPHQTESSVVTDAAQLFRDYPFTTDETYQQGLASIIADGILDGKAEAEKEEMLRRTELFYFNRIMGRSLTFEEVFKPTPTTSASTTDESRTLTFAELKDLIEQGKTDQIPNNRHVPEAINNAPPSESTTLSRKKPWEIPAE